MNVIRRLPEREKSPEKCCASKKVKGKYIDPVNIYIFSLFICI